MHPFSPLRGDGGGASVSELNLLNRKFDQIASVMQSVSAGSLRVQQSVG